MFKCTYTVVLYRPIALIIYFRFSTFGLIEEGEHGRVATVMCMNLHILIGAYITPSTWEVWKDKEIFMVHFSIQYAEAVFYTIVAEHVYACCSSSCKYVVYIYLLLLVLHVNILSLG